MFTRIRICAALATVIVFSIAFAVTGSSSIPAGTSGSSYGYVSGFMGSISSPTLSDGKTVFALWDDDWTQLSDLGITPGHYLTLAIGGHSIDPGQSYINHAYVSCGAASTTYSSGSASYGWSTPSHNAVWTWYLGSDVCMASGYGSSYSLSID